MSSSRTKTTSASTADLIPISSFVSVSVPDTKKLSIKSFIESNSLQFKKGYGFYELTKPELISFDKKILVQRLVDPSTLVTGSTVKDILGIKDKNAGKWMVEEEVLKEFRLFIQSTSYNRILVPGSTFLYIKDGTDPFEVATAAATTRLAAGPAEAEAPAPKKVRKNDGNASKGNGQIEIVFSFDTTGSMFPCLSTVRTVIHQTLLKLTTTIPNIRIGILAHGDYEDFGTTYVTKAAADYKFCDASQLSTLVDFVQNVGSTCGYDFPECYELVLNEARTKFDWSPGSAKALVLIGDAPPHEPADNPYKLDWRKEGVEYKSAGIRVYAVQALSNASADYFWTGIANDTAGFHLRLHQFSLIVDFMTAVVYHEGDVADGSGESHQLSNFETELSSSGRMVKNLRQLFDKLQGRESTSEVSDSSGGGGLIPISPTRFQVLTVDKDQDIKGFATERGLIFKVGRGFYEFTKPEAISEKKEVVLMDRTSGDFYTGWEAARAFAGIETGPNANKRKQSPKNNDKYSIFVQSSSYNRKLMAGSRFLYEVDTDK